MARPRALSKHDLRWIAAARDRGESWKAIARQFDIHPATLWRATKEANVARRRSRRIEPQDIISIEAARAIGLSWKVIAHRFGMERASLSRALAAARRRRAAAGPG